MTARIGSLFSGAGGLDLAVEQVFSGETVWHSELDPAASKVLAHRWPGIPNLGDITKIDWTAVEPVDILAGGFPCQPFSAAGARQGETDDRHLWPYFLEAIRALRPRFVVLENVAGLRSIGGIFDEPPLRCVCGWAGRRGGVHYREVQQNGDGHRDPGADRHGREISDHPDPDAEHIRRDANHPGAGESRTCADHDLDRDGHRGGRFPETHRTTPATEGRAGGGGVEDRADTDVPGTHWIAGPLSLDAGIGRSMPGATSPIERVERTWSGFVGGEGTQLVCPACGGTMGDRSSRHVFRSGLGTVYRDLAGIGFDADWCSVRASDVGAPHRRERLFVVAYPSDRTGYGQWACTEPRQGDQAAADSKCGEWSGQRFPRRNGTAFTSVGRHSVAPAHSSGGRLEECPQLDGHPVGPRLETPQRHDADRRCDASPDSSCDGRHEGRPEPTRFVGGFDAAIGGAGPVDLLPTPAACNPNDGETPETWLARRERVKLTANNGNGMGMPLSIAVQLLPTPMAHDAKGTGPSGYDRNSPELARIDHYVTPTGNWGKYGPAIHRWEALTRPAPPPTEPNTRGNPRLNPAFSEWLMGWPDGWVTGVPGISRNDQLRIIGNGVVDRCAIAALRWLLTVSEMAA